MALSETLSETSICNQALGRIGSLRIKGNVETEESVHAIQCRLHYEQTRDSLIRSYEWRFASGRETLTQDTSTPDFEWDFQYPLPDDFMAMKSIFEGRFTAVNFRNYTLEGDLLLTDEDEMEIRYTKKVTDVSEFDSLFVKVLILQLADVLIGPLAGGDARIQRKITDALDELMPSVRALDGQETNTAGRFESRTWDDARFEGRNPMRL